MWKVSKNKRNWNGLVDWFKQGDGWVRTTYDYTRNAYWHTQEPYGWSRFGAVKFNEDELVEMINELKEWLIHNNPTEILKELKIVYR